MASYSKFYFLVALLSLLITEVTGEDGELYFHFLRADIKSTKLDADSISYSLFSVFFFIDVKLT